MKTQTPHPQNFFQEIREERNTLLAQIRFYNDRQGILNSSTEKAFMSLERLIESGGYEAAIKALEALKLSRTDKQTIYYLPTKWLCALRVLQRCIVARKTQRASLCADIEAEIAETLGLWVPLGGGCYSLMHPHPDAWRIEPPCKGNIVRF